MKLAAFGAPGQDGVQLSLTKEQPFRLRNKGSYDAEFRLIGNSIRATDLPDAATEVWFKVAVETSPLNS
jgi:hypothetical protein